jgi:murein DD-endopeptidase
MWSAQALGTLSYVSTGVLGAGVSALPPQLADGGVDPRKTPRLEETSGAAVFWAQIYGLRKGDVEELRLIAPDGRELARRRTPVARNQAQSFAYIGLRRRGAAWPAGTYRGDYALYRGSPPEKVVSLAREARIP